jgi:hypothetical protein
MRVIEPVKGIIVVSRDVGVAMKMCGRMAGSERRRTRVPIRPGVDNRIALRAAGTMPMALTGHFDDRPMPARTRDIGHSAIVGYFDHASNHRCGDASPGRDRRAGSVTADLVETLARSLARVTSAERPRVQRCVAHRRSTTAA